MYLKIVDFGLVVLIWIVQLVIYPGFYYYEKEALLKWHAKYTGYISVIVMPLMLGQLGLHIYWIFEDLNVIRGIVLIMILANWAVTFLVAVPLHGNISNGKDLVYSLQSLVRTNWIRTILWTIVFVTSLLTHQKSL